MGIQTYFILPAPSTTSTPLETPHTADLIVSNGIVSLAFNTTSGLLSAWTDVASGVTTPFSQALMWYNSSANNQDATDNSGAYDFRPNASTPFSLPGDGTPVVTSLAASVGVLLRAIVQ